jgi:hypothetical protein
LKEFLASDPKLTEEDYEYWKNWSDDIYKDQDYKTQREGRKDLSIENMEEVFSFVSTSLEEDYESNEYKKKKIVTLIKIVLQI